MYSHHFLIIVYNKVAGRNDDKLFSLYCIISGPLVAMNDEFRWTLSSSIQRRKPNPWRRKKMYRKARSKLYIFSKTRDDYEFTDAWKCLAQCSGSLTMFAALISFLLNAHDSSARTERVECYVKFAHKTVENYETINPSRYLTFQYLSPCATATLWASQSTIKSHKFRLIFPLLGFYLCFGS